MSQNIVVSSNNSQAKALLLRGLENREDKYQEIVKTASVASKRKMNYHETLCEQSLDVLPKDIDDLKYCIIAMRSLKKQDIKKLKDYLLNLLFRIYTDFFLNPEYERLKPKSVI